MTRYPAVVFFIGCCTLLWGGQQFPARPGESVVAGEYLIRLNSPAGGAPVHTVLGLPPGTVSQDLGRLNLHLVRIPPVAAVALDAIANHPLVQYIEPNRVRRVSLSAPNDTQLAQQWALTNIQAQQTWTTLPAQFFTAFTMWTSRTRVAVLDTGIDCTHPDFQNSSGTSTNSALGGQISFALSRAYYATTVANPACSFQDDHGHGTHTAGIVAAASNNSRGVASLGYPLELVIFKILDHNGTGSDAVVATAIMDAADAGVKIISMSLGGGGYSQTIQNAVTYAWSQGALVVCAAGNGNTNALVFPAGANHAVGVAATNSNNLRASFSNFGDYVSIAAPGVSVMSTLPTYATSIGGLNYGNLSGTSMATPHISALAGMLLLSSPGLAPAAMLQQIQKTASSSNVNGGWGQTNGYGIMRAGNALAGTLRASSQGSIVGQVVDATGAPVAGVTLSVGGLSRVTDATGLYRFPNLTTGTYTLTATTTPAQNLPVYVPDGADTTVTIVSGANPGTFTGTVTRAGAPVSGAVVQALSSGLLQAAVFTNTLGQYTLPVPAGTYDLQAGAISMIGSSVAGQSVAAGAAKTVNLAIARMGWIAGTVRNGSQAPVANAQIVVRGTNFSAGAVTDSGGNYTTMGVPAGTYGITASSPGFTDVTINATVAPDSASPGNIQLGSSVPSSSSAAFVKTDSTTQGNWRGVYGADGYHVINDTVAYPGYVTVTPSGQSGYTWASSTSDMRALRKAASATDRIAATWYSGSSFIVDLNFSDQATHQVAIYCLDWDTTSRTQTVDILDANNLLLDTRSMSNFNGGQYLVWKVSGHVKIRATRTGVFNAVIGGIFFDPAGAAPPPLPAPVGGAATFVKSDTTTQGNWKGVYGTGGYTVINDSVAYPNYVTVTPSGQSSYVWAYSTGEVRAPLKALSATDRIASVWYSGTSFTVDLNFSDQLTHQVAIYCMDWDFAGRVQTVEILDGNNTVLDTRSVSNFANGQYLVWTLSGHVIIRATRNAGFNAIINAIFFDPTGPAPPAGGGTASFVKLDTTTRGSWKGVYGAAGYHVINDSVAYPGYVTVAPSGQSSYTWAASTSDLRALSKAASPTDRIAGTWYSGSSFTVDLTFADQAAHQVAIYCVDWDTNERVQTVEILDGNTNAVLDTRSMASFNGGQYLVWKVSGHVKIRAVRAAGFNAVIGGLFWD